MSFSKDNEAFLRSQGWSGTKWDEPRDSSFKDKDQHIYDSLLKAAGDDNELTTQEYETIYNDRGVWGDTAYSRDSVAKALAQLGSQTGIKLDQETMDRHDLTYSGDDILQRVSASDRGPDAFKKDDYKVSWERGIEDRDDQFNVFRWGSNIQEKEKEKEEEVEPVKPELECPSGQVRGTSGACIEDKEYADNPWEEPKKTPKELADLRDVFDSYDPGAGSIDYLTPNMSRQYKPNVGSGKFAGVLRANQYQQDRSN